MNAVAKIIDEIEDYRIDWEAHGWSSEEKCFVANTPGHRMEVAKAKENASRIDSINAADLTEKIDFSFLTRDGADGDIPEWLATIWYMNFPIDARTSRNIVQSAMRVPKESIEPLYFPLAPIEGPKKKFFDALVEFGRANGLAIVGNELYAGARAGDPRAVKMYLDLMGVLDEDAKGERDGLVRVELKF
jgi:hypothetical protein